jgi:hypothetical protein
MMKISCVTAYRRVAGIGAGCVLGGMGMGIVGTPSVAAAPQCSPEGVRGTVSPATGSARQYLDSHPGADQAVVAAYNQPRRAAAGSRVGLPPIHGRLIWEGRSTNAQPDAMITAMDVDHPEDDQRWDRRERGETEVERLDRNWNSLLQELRVVQTGVQLLTGFLLTLPFQQRFDVLSEQMRMVYLATVGFSVGATVLLISPVAMHRLLFRRHRLQVLVSAAHRCACAGLALLGAALTGVTIIIFAAVSGHNAGYVAGACALALFTFFWWVLPLMLRTRGM